MISHTSPTFQEPHRTVRILYAEDIHELRDLARVVFSREGHTVECAVDGLDALEKLTAELGGYDLVVTDHQMPRMNGLDFVHNVRQLPFHGKIMVFSSELSPAVALEYRKLGVDRILFKPIYPSLLRQAIAELFPLVHVDVAAAI